MAGVPPTNHVRECPYCGVRSQFPLLTSASGQPARIDPAIDDSPRVQSHSAVYVCANCGRSLFAYAWGDNLENLVTFPTKVPRVPNELPAEVAEIYKEALVCHGARAWNATAVMCRRTIQEAVLILNAQGKDLFNQIEFLDENRTIPPELVSYAHEIRLIGKDGAHADVPTDISPDDANEAIDFTSRFLEYVFILKEKLEGRKARQSQAKP